MRWLAHHRAVDTTRKSVREHFVTLTTSSSAGARLVPQVEGATCGNRVANPKLRVAGGRSPGGRGVQESE